MRVYLNTPLFVVSGREPHLPKGITCIEGELEGVADGLVSLFATAYFDHRGQALEAPGRHLMVPFHKVDHVDKGAR